MMRRLLNLTFLFAWGCLAAPGPPTLVDLADRARSLPAEFAADALLRIADAPQVTDAAWKGALIEDAFRRAGAAQEPYARRAWLEARAGKWGRAFAQGLDACTLECRAVHAMLALDRKKARELFAEIPPLKLPRLSCDDPLVYDVSIYYATLGEVVEQAFSPKEIAEEEPLHWVTRYTAAITSPVETGPAAHILAGAPLKPAQLAAAVSSWAGALASVADDDRSFSASISGQTELAGLVQACTRHEISPMPLLDAWRAYLVRHLSGARCADTVSEQPRGTSFGMTARLTQEQTYSGPLGPAQFFNDHLRTGELHAIAGDEAKPAKVEGQARAMAGCESTECSQLGKQFAALLLNPAGVSYTEEQRAGGEWGAKLREYLAALAAWKGAGDPAECFRAKSHFYVDLFSVTPVGPNRDAVLGALLAWLQQNAYQREHRAEWFYPVNLLIIRAFADPVVMKAVIGDLRKSPDPVISFYTELEQVLPRPLERMAPLL